MTDPDQTWIEIPEMLEMSALAELTRTFDAVGIEHQHRSVTIGVSLNGSTLSGERRSLAGHPTEQHAYSLYVRREHVHGAAMILRAYFEVFDPKADVSFTGDCPACGEPLVQSWACTSCELGFRTPEDPEDLLLPFLREHGGFDPPCE